MSNDAQSTNNFKAHDSAERTLIIQSLAQLVEPLASLMADCEVVVHDLSQLPTTIVAIAGGLTGRRVGDPATDVLLKQMAEGRVRTMVNYSSVLPDGRRIRCATIAVKDSRGNPVAALCINSSVEIWSGLLKICQQMLYGNADVSSEPKSEAELDEDLNQNQQYGTEKAGSETGQIGQGTGSAEANSMGEAFVHNLDDLANIVLDRAVASQGVPVELMTKSHKKEVIRQAKEQGFFFLRDAAETLADRLQISRFTVYNYLKEIDKTTSVKDEKKQ